MAMLRSMVNSEQIQSLAPTAKPELVAAIVRNWAAAQRAGINTPVRTQHFLAQIATETGGFRSIDENLNYSAKRLREVWPSRFKTDAAARQYANQPEKLANFVYGSRLGNGPPSSGDGWRYRGGGFIQTTGRANYGRAGYENDPAALRDPDRGFLAALTFWTDNGLNALADTDDVTAVRKRINGGINGLAEAKRYTAKAKAIWATAADLGGPAPAPPVHRPVPPQPPRPVEDFEEPIRGDDKPVSLIVAFFRWLAGLFRK